MESINAIQTLPRLFLKCLPPDSPDGFIFSRYVQELNASLSFRPLDLSLDLELIHQWVNKAYSQRFWQLSGARSTIENIYAGIMENPQAHSFIGLINKKPFCQVDVYAIQYDELANHVEAKPGDCGLHLLMCPPRELQKGWSVYALRVFQQFYFSFEQANRLFAEPDQDNHLATQLARSTGFRFIKTVELSYKTAHLYCMSREHYQPL